MEIEAESVASNTTHCKKTLSTRSSNSDTEASESCNIQPVKRPRKKRKKMAGPSEYREIQELETQVMETQALETQVDLVDPFIREINFPKDTIKAILTVAEKVSVFKSSRMVTLTESTLVAERLLAQYSILVTKYEVNLVLNIQRENFKSYCALMRKGKKGMQFEYDTGSVCRLGGCEMEEILLVKNMYRDVTDNFNILKKLFPDIYNPPSSSKISSKRKSSRSGTYERNKKSKSSSSVNDQFSLRTGSIKSRIARELPFLSDICVHGLLVKHFEDQNKCSQFLRYDNDTFMKEILNMCCEK